MVGFRSDALVQRPKSNMGSAQKTAELLAQIARAFHFGDDRQALKDREWLSLFFLSRANKFSRTPSGLASFMGVTKSVTSQIVRMLVEKSYLRRERSQRDERCISLSITPKAERLLAGEDPSNRVLLAVAALVPEDDETLSGLLDQIVARIDWPHDVARIGQCRNCLFLTRGPPSQVPGLRIRTDLRCRFHRAIIEPDETDRICTSFVRA
jgi:MarR family transcriptional regulator, negative regulator of the multidrug operon emrRAB